MERWFYSGTQMRDGTPITIAARSEVEAQECLARGLVPLEEAAPGTKGGAGRARTRRQRQGKAADQGS